MHAPVIAEYRPGTIEAGLHGPGRGLRVAHAGRSPGGATLHRGSSQ